MQSIWIAILNLQSIGIAEFDLQSIGIGAHNPHNLRKIELQ